MSNQVVLKAREPSGSRKCANERLYILHLFCGSDVEKSLLRVGAMRGVAPSMIGCLTWVTCKGSGEFSCDGVVTDISIGTDWEVIDQSERISMRM